jgi:protein-S-isoprenylcysteine O-methyltransferase Ste14
MNRIKLIATLIVGQTVLFFGLFALALFVPAGTLAWPAAWVFLCLFFSFFLTVNIWLFRHNPGLLKERAHLGTSDQKGWDKLLFPLLLLIPFAWLAFMALDVNRWHWSAVPFWLQGMGALVLLASFYVLFLAFRENTYLSTVVRIQEERGHTVISSGPYHYVRHPMYAGILVFTIGTSLLLGSWYGVLFGFLLILVVARRAVLEERTLSQELPGYTLYMARVRYRLIPLIW